MAGGGALPSMAAQHALFGAPAPAPAPPAHRQVPPHQHVDPTSPLVPTTAQERTGLQIIVVKQNDYAVNIGFNTIDMVQHSNNTIHISPSHLTPIHGGNMEVNASSSVIAWTTLEPMVIIVLLPIVMQVLLQTNMRDVFQKGSTLVTPVIFCLLINVVATFAYILLLLSKCYRRNNCIKYAARLSLGLSALAMALVVTLRAFDLASGFFLGSNS